MTKTIEEQLKACVRRDFNFSSSSRRRNQKELQDLRVAVLNSSLTEVLKEDERIFQLKCGRLSGSTSMKRVIFTSSSL